MIAAKPAAIPPTGSGQFIDRAESAKAVCLNPMRCLCQPFGD